MRFILLFDPASKKNAKKYLDCDQARHLSQKLYISSQLFHFFHFISLKEFSILFYVNSFQINAYYQIETSQLLKADHKKLENSCLLHSKMLRLFFQGLQRYIGNPKNWLVLQELCFIL